MYDRLDQPTLAVLRRLARRALKNRRYYADPFGDSHDDPCADPFHTEMSTLNTKHGNEQ